MIANIIIRSETPDDYQRISLIHDLTFNRPNEGVLVNNLRFQDDFDPKLSLVAESNINLIGHILLYPCIIKGREAEYLTLSLGPISVIPDYQKQGVGSQLVKHGHQVAKELGYQSIILLGHPGYYPRFGYKKAVNWGLTNPWNIHNEAFMAIEVAPGGLDGKAGLVVYPDEFNEVS